MDFFELIFDKVRTAIPIYAATRTNYAKDGTELTSSKENGNRNRKKITEERKDNELVQKKTENRKQKK